MSDAPAGGLSELEALVARSRSPGAFVERRRFTLARGRAVEKLREFSLRDPHQYVLELIQAAVFAGAESVAIDVDAGGILFAYVGGRPLSQAQAEGIFDYLFTDRVDPETRHLSQLAVGLNAVLQRRPSRLRIESGDGGDGGALRVDLDRSGRGVVGVAGAPLRGTYLEVRFGGLGRWLGRGLPPEQALVEERCLYTPIPILLNNTAPFGHFADRGLTLFSVRDQLIFDTGARRGVLGVPIGTDSHRFRVVIGGVWVTTLSLPELGSVPNNDWEIGSFREPFIGVLCDDHLKKTADQSGVVRDARFGALLGVVRPLADTLAARVSRRGLSMARRRERPADALPMLGVRGGLPRSALSALPADAPLFRVDPAMTAWLAGPADPLCFPHRVLVLSGERAAAELGDRVVHRLSGPEAIDFYQRVLQIDEAPRTLEIPCALATPVPMEGVLSLRLHPGGGAPAWGPPAAGVPALVVHAGRSEWSGALSVELPAVSLVFRAEALARVPGDALSAALTAALRRYVSGLITDAPASPGERALALGILARASRPRRLKGGLYAVVDERWGGAGRLRALPLLPGGQSLSQWLADPDRGAAPEALRGWLGEDPGAPSEEEMMAGLSDPRHPGWLAREPVSMPGLRGWLGLADSYDATTRVVVALDRGGASLALALPCRGRLQLTGRSALTRSQLDRLRVAVARLTDAAGDGALAARYRARFGDWEAGLKPHPQRSQPAAELSRRLEAAMLDGPGARALRLTMESGDGPAIRVDERASEGRLVRLRLNTRYPWVRDAQRPGVARELVLLESLRLICAWLDEQGHPVDFLEVQQTLTAQRPRGSGAPPVG